MDRAGPARITDLPLPPDGHLLLFAFPEDDSCYGDVSLPHHCDFDLPDDLWNESERPPQSVELVELWHSERGGDVVAALSGARGAGRVVVIAVP